MHFITELSGIRRNGIIPLDTARNQKREPRDHAAPGRYPAGNRLPIEVNTISSVQAESGINGTFLPSLTQTDFRDISRRGTVSI